jgi:hypothetical protein
VQTHSHSNRVRFCARHWCRQRRSCRQLLAWGWSIVRQLDAPAEHGGQFLSKSYARRMSHSSADYFVLIIKDACEALRSTYLNAVKRIAVVRINQTRFAKHRPSKALLTSQPWMFRIAQPTRRSQVWPPTPI